MQIEKEKTKLTEKKQMIDKTNLVRKGKSKDLSFLHEDSLTGNKTIDLTDRVVTKALMKNAANATAKRKLVPVGYCYHSVTRSANFGPLIQNYLICTDNLIKTVAYSLKLGGGVWNLCAYFFAECEIEKISLHIKSLW